MKIINVKRKNSRTTNCIVSLIDDNGIDIEIELSMDLVIRERLSKYMEINDILYNKLISEQHIIDAKQTAFNYISYRKRSKKQVIERLKQKEFTEEEIALAVDYLEKNNLLNDEIFAKSLIKDILLTKKIGKNEIYNQLYIKGVDKEIIEKMLNEYSFIDTFETAILVAERKYKLLINKKPIEKVKQSLFNHLIAKGFDFDETKKAIEIVITNDLQEQ